jgi:putative Ca2+/H+ antiporter (TMEM165/GDT1 family)
MWAYGFCFLSVFLAELPDKTSLLVMSLAPRRKRLVWAAASAALVAQTALAVAAGQVLTRMNPTAVRIAEAALLLGFAAWLGVRPAAADDEAEVAGRMGAHRKLFLSAFLAVFAAEFGDLTQIAVLSWSTRLGTPMLVFLVGSAALVSAAYVSASAGVLLRRLLSAQTIARMGAATMAAVGVWMLFAG